MAVNKNNNKIFTEEDFDKPSPKPVWYKTIGGKTCIGVIAVAVIAAIVFFTIKGCTSCSSKGGGTRIEDPYPPIDTMSPKTETRDTTSVLTEVSDGATPLKSEGDEKKSSNVNENDRNSTSDSSNAGKISDGAPQKSNDATADVKTEALSVIRGNYGNNPVRRRLLGDRYQEIQNKVNEMYHNGLVH